MLPAAETPMTDAPVPPRLRPSALRRSALQRLGFVALPVAFLWLGVGFALDVWR